VSSLYSRLPDSMRRYLPSVASRRTRNAVCATSSSIAGIIKPETGDCGCSWWQWTPKCPFTIWSCVKDGFAVMRSSENTALHSEHCQTNGSFVSGAKATGIRVAMSTSLPQDGYQFQPVETKRHHYPLFLPLFLLVPPRYLFPLSFRPEGGICFPPQEARHIAMLCVGPVRVYRRLYPVAPEFPSLSGLGGLAPVLGLTSQANESRRLWRLNLRVRRPSRAQRRDSLAQQVSAG
jgi:hypothetical protein